MTIFGYINIDNKFIYVSRCFRLYRRRPSIQQKAKEIIKQLWLSKFWIGQTYSLTRELSHSIIMAKGLYAISSSQFMREKQEREYERERERHLFAGQDMDTDMGPKNFKFIISKKEAGKQESKRGTVKIGIT